MNNDSISLLFIHNNFALFDVRFDSYARQSERSAKKQLRFVESIQYNRTNNTFLSFHTCIYLFTVQMNAYTQLIQSRSFLSSAQRTATNEKTTHSIEWNKRCSWLCDLICMCHFSIQFFQFRRCVYACVCIVHWPFKLIFFPFAGWIQTTQQLFKFIKFIVPIHLNLNLLCRHT